MGSCLSKSRRNGGANQEGGSRPQRLSLDEGKISEPEAADNTGDSRESVTAAEDEGPKPEPAAVTTNSEGGRAEEPASTGKAVSAASTADTGLTTAQLQTEGGGQTAEGDRDTPTLAEIAKGRDDGFKREELFVPREAQADNADEAAAQVTTAASDAGNIPVLVVTDTSMADASKEGASAEDTVPAAATSVEGENAVPGEIQQAQEVVTEKANAEEEETQAGELTANETNTGEVNPAESTVESSEPGPDAEVSASVEQSELPASNETEAVAVVDNGE